MKAQLKALAWTALLSLCTVGQAQNTASANPSAKKPASRRRQATAKAPAGPSVQTQIDQLRQDMENQIQQLKQQLSDRDQQLQQAQQAAAAAQQAAQQAQQQAQEQSSQNAQSVSNLQGAVNELKTNNTALATQVQQQKQEQVKVQHALENPDTIHYKGATISPTGSFLAAETVYRQRATGGGLNTPLTGIPLNFAPQGQYSEWYGTGRQSRIAILGQGKLENMTIGGYYEGDFLGTGITSNNNQSNSYVFRQRQVWAQAAMNNGWTFTGGQMWTLATETGVGMQNRTELVPLTIDPQYTAGFVWARQYAFRVTKNLFGNKFFVGASAENAQIPSVVGHNLPPNFIVGQAGTGGGLYNPTANYASNVAPDMIAKIAWEPGWGHYELFGIARFFRDRVYPDATAKPPSSAGAYNDTTTGGGIGGGFRVPTFHKRLDVGLKGLWGDGVGRYGSSQIADTTARPDGTLALIHGFSALSTLEYHANGRLDVYVNYGGDYAGRRYFIQGAGQPVVGYGAYTNVETGCDTEPPPPSSNGGYTPGSLSNCTADTKDVQELTVGYWYNFYNGPKGRLRQGLQYAYFQRGIWSGIGTTPQGTDNMFWTSFRYYLP